MYCSISTIGLHATASRHANTYQPTTVLCYVIVKELQVCNVYLLDIIIEINGYEIIFFLKEDFITKSTKHNTKNYNYLQNMYKPTTTKISNTVHHKQDIMKR